MQSRIRSLEAFLIEEGVSKLKKLKPKILKPIYVHLHCHERSLEGEQSIEGLAKALDIELQMLPSGCCGMAGSFGFEQEHYELSQDIAESKIAPALRSLDADALILSSGTSCRSQWNHTCARSTLATASVFLKILEKNH